MKYTYKTKGTCSTKIDIELSNDTIVDVKFTGGCNGNLKGISALVKGMNINDVINKFEGIQCSYKKTSCPDQLAQALKAAKLELNKVLK